MQQQIVVLHKAYCQKQAIISADLVLTDAQMKLRRPTWQQMLTSKFADYTGAVAACSLRHAGEFFPSVSVLNKTQKTEQTLTAYIKGIRKKKTKAHQERRRRWRR